MINILATTCAIGGVDIPNIIINLIHYLIVGIKILIPVALIVFGMIDMGKAVISNDDKVMKEAQGKLIKRIIYAVVIFLIVALVQFVFNVLDKANGDDGKTGAVNCIDAIVNDR